jgi:hypothetical protein
MPETRSSLHLPEISDEFMRQSASTTRGYTIVILKKGPAYDPPRTDSIIWEHGRRNHALRAAGLLSIVCPIRDGTELAGVGIFEAEQADVEGIIGDDPAVRAGVLTYEIHPASSFPGDCLPPAGARNRTGARGLA